MPRPRHSTLLAGLMWAGWLFAAVLSCRSDPGAAPDGSGERPEHPAATTSGGSGGEAFTAELDARPIALSCPWDEPTRGPSEIVIRVATVYPGASPLDVERGVSLALAEYTWALPGVERVRAVSREGRALLLVSFRGGVDPWTAVDRVREQVVQARTVFPEAAERPVVQATFQDRRQLWIVSADALSLLELTEVAESVARSLMAVPGLLAADVLGGAYPEIDVRLDPDRLAAYQLTAADVVAAIEAAGVALPALARPRPDGLAVGEGTAATRETLEAVAVAFVDGQPVRVGNVAEVGRSVGGTELTWSWLDGRLAVAIALTSRADRPPEATALDAVAREARASAPAGLQLERLDWTTGSRVRIELDSSGEPAADRGVLRRLADQVGGVPEGDHVLARLGGGAPSVPGPGGTGLEPGAAVIDLWLAPGADRNVIMEALTRLTREVEPSARIAWPGRRLVLAVEVEPGEAESNEATSALARRVQSVPGVLSTRRRSRSVEQFDLRTDREALARYGLTAARVARQLALAFHGLELGRSPEGESIRVSLAGGLDADQLGDLTLQVRGPDGEYARIPLRDVVSIEQSAQPEARYLLDGRSVDLLDVDVSPAAPETTCDDIAQAAGAFAAQSGRFVSLWASE